MDIKVDAKTVVVFDLDDTLYNELDYLISAYKELALFLDNKNSKQLFSVMLFMYRSKTNVFDYLVKTYSVDKEILLEKYRNHKPAIVVNKGVINLFQSLKKTGCKIAMITDGRSVTQRNKISALGIENYFDYISISEEIKAEKPSLIPFSKVEKIFPNANKYYYIGDNCKKDFVAPNQLNWETMGLVDLGKNIHINNIETLEKHQIPNSFIYSLKEINLKNFI